MRSVNDLIERAKVACQESKYDIFDHFAVQRKMMNIGSKITRKIIDYKLSRYACYLIAKNGGTMPEDLPTPSKSLKELTKNKKERLIEERTNRNE